MFDPEPLPVRGGTVFTSSHAARGGAVDEARPSGLSSAVFRIDSKR
jgi:hypothetical protein